MAPIATFVTLVLLVMPSMVTAGRGPPHGSCPSFYPVLAFGDSTTDTGNAIVSVTRNAFTAATRLPYGITFFHRPTGRFSDGRLIVDFLMAALKLPFLPPHLSSSSPGFQNFAVAGATALDAATLQRLSPGVMSTTPDSLDVQLQWFKTDTAKFDLHNALIYLGEIGGNDYNYALAISHNPFQVASLVQPVISKVASFLDALLSANVKKVVIQGQFPLGCLPIYLTTLATLPKDAHGCVAAVTAISDLHNQLLKRAIAEVSARHPDAELVSARHPDAELVFLDTSAAYLQILDHAPAYGFFDTVDACFPGGLFEGLLPNREGRAFCNPRKYISWDGLHLTDAMYGAMVKLFLTNEQFSSPPGNILVTAAALCN